MPIIEVSHVTKEFRLGQLGSLKETMLNNLRRLRGEEIHKPRPFKALNDVDFNVEAGEVLGIIGTNGAGKSTLLKMLARISVPSAGKVVVRGKVAPLIEVGAGLIADLTGRENVFLNGAILGMSRAEVKRKFDDIVAFAELEEFIDTPVKRYSSGMAVRLGFSIATSVDAEVLIVDEVLAVGDLAFQRKCFDRMEDIIKKRGNTVLLVSHNIRQVERLCTRTILLDRGEIILDDTPEKACDLFYERSDKKVHDMSAKSPAIRKAELATSELQVVEMRVMDADGNASNVVEHYTSWRVAIRLKLFKPLPSPAFGIGIHTTDFLYLTTHNSESELHLNDLVAGEYEVVWQVKDCPLLPGVYSLKLTITTGKAATVVFSGENLAHFQVVSNRDARITAADRQGFFSLEAAWSRPEKVESLRAEPA